MKNKRISSLLNILLIIVLLVGVFSLAGCSNVGNQVFVEATHFAHPYPKDGGMWFENSVTVLYNGDCEIIRKSKNEKGEIVSEQYFRELMPTEMNSLDAYLGHHYIEHQDVSRGKNLEQWEITSYNEKGELIFDYSGFADDADMMYPFLALSIIMFSPLLV